MPYRQEKIRQRERHILDQAWSLVAKDGFLALKISEVAKRAGISVGTLYVHFESKEDLIVAMALDTWHTKLGLMMQATAIDARAIERLLAVVIASYHFDLNNPVRFEAQQLAGIPSIWQRAAERPHEELIACSSAFDQQIEPLVREAIDDGDLDINGDHCPLELLHHSLWVLNVGNAYISHVFRPSHKQEICNKEECLPAVVRRNTLGMLRGLGWQPADAEGVYEKIQQQVMRLPVPQLPEQQLTEAS